MVFGTERDVRTDDVNRACTDLVSQNQAYFIENSA